MSDFKLQLLPHQRALLKALETKDKALGSMYYGALKVMNDNGNPDRFALAAHSIRELMEKLPYYLELRLKATKETLKEKVRQLESAWSICCENSTCYDPTELCWKGRINGHLKKFLQALGKFFSWFEEHHPRRKEEISRILKELDPSDWPLPKPIEELKVEEWDRIRTFFIDVAHHRKNVEPKEFNSWVHAFERLMLNYFYPKTFDDFQAIDAIIVRVEGE